MLISKFDLYNPEWLELVFSNRNKAYGAYELRRQYGHNMVIAMAATFSFIGLLFCAGLVFHSSHNVPPLPADDHHIIQLVAPPAAQIKQPKPPAAEHATPPEHPVATIRDLPPVVAPDPIAQTPPKNVELETAAIGTTTTKGDPTAGSTPLPITSGTGDAPAPAPDNSVHDLGGVDVMPAPVGGEAAWMKFLSRNLRYPEQAQADGISGRVYMSFVIEKDGTLSNITVMHAAGNGFDEEATRVLKLAKAWKPGMQNGQPVRVKYIIPINFQAADQP